MRRRHVIESNRDRMALAHDAGYGRISGVSILAGTLVAYGAFAVVLELVPAELGEGATG